MAAAPKAIVASAPAKVAKAVAVVLPTPIAELAPIVPTNIIAEASPEVLASSPEIDLNVGLAADNEVTTNEL